MELRAHNVAQSRARLHDEEADALPGYAPFARPFIPYGYDAYPPRAFVVP